MPLPTSSEEMMSDWPKADYSIVRDGALIAVSKKRGEIIKFDPLDYDRYVVSGPYVGEGVERQMTQEQARQFGLRFGIDIGEPSPPNEDGISIQQVRHHTDGETAHQHPAEPSRGKRRSKSTKLCRWCGKPVRGKGFYCNASHKQKWLRQKDEGNVTSRSGGVNIDATNVTVGGKVVHGNKIGHNRPPANSSVRKAKPRKPKKAGRIGRRESDGSDVNIGGDVVGGNKYVGPDDDTSDDLIGGETVRSG